MTKFDFIYSVLQERLTEVERELSAINVSSTAFTFCSGRKSAFKDLKTVMDSIKD